MKILTRRFFVASCAALFCIGLIAESTQAQDTPSTDEIIEMHIKNLGGRSKLESVKTIKSKAVMIMPGPGGEMEADIEQLQSGKKFLMILEIPGFGEVKQGSNGEHFWMINPQTGAKLMSDEEKAMVMAQYSQPFPALAWNDFDGEIKNEGESDVDGEKCYKLVFKPKTGNDITRYFEVETGQLVKMETKQTSQMGEIEVSVYPSDFKKVNGITVPHKQVTEMAFGEMTMEIDEIKYNEKIDDDKFKLPEEIQELVDEGK